MIEAQCSLRGMLVVLMLMLCGMSAQAQHLELPLSIGSTARVWSEALGEERQLLLYLPPYYEVSGKKYPVLYILDGEDHFLHSVGIVQFLATYNERIPEMIVVGVTNSRASGHRTLDLTPPLEDIEESRRMSERMSGDRHGGASLFLKFMADELVPWIDARYRTAPYRMLMGHSLGGLFNTYAMLHRPETFQAHIAVSPSLWWDKEAVVARTEAGIRQLPKPPWLFLSWSDNEPPIGALTSKLVSQLTERPVAGLKLEHRYYAGEDHLSTPHRSLYDALERLFADWRMPSGSAGNWREVTLDRIDAHYTDLSARFGFPITPPPAAYRATTWSFDESASKKEALAVLRRGVREHPYLADLHGSLGELLEKLDRKEEARVAYRDAVKAAVSGQAFQGSEIADFCGKLRNLGGTALPVSCPMPPSQR